MIASVSKHHKLVALLREFINEINKSKNGTWIANEVSFCILYSKCLRFREENGTAEPKFNRIFNLKFDTYKSVFWRLYYAAIEVAPTDFLRFCVPQMVCNVEEAFELLKEFEFSERITKIVETHRLVPEDVSSKSELTRKLRNALDSFPLINSAIQLDADTEKAVEQLNSQYFQLDEALSAALANYENPISSLSNRKLRNTHRIIQKVNSLYLLKGLLEKRELNDVAIGTSLLYELVVRNFDIQKSENQHILIVNASPYFVEKWLNDDALRDVKVTFAYKSIIVAKLFSLSKYVVGRNNIQFVDDEELKRRRFTNNNIKFTYLVIYEPTSKVVNTKYIIRDWLWNCELQGKIILFSGTQMLENKGLCYKTDQTIVNANHVIILPQGYTYSSIPKRKAISFFTFSSEEGFVSSKSFLLSEYYLEKNQDSKGMKLVRDPRLKGFPVKYGDINKDKSLRHTIDMEKRLDRFMEDFKPFNKSPILFQFSPELPIWYSKKEDNGKLKVIACFYNPSKKRPKDIQSRGRRIEATRKTETIDESKTDLMTWLSEDYPYSSYSKRTRTGKTTIRGSIKVNIRDEVARVYEPVFRERLLKGSAQNDSTIEPISLRTIWYVYPEKMDVFSDADQKIVMKMLHGEVGLLRTDAKEADEFLGVISVC